MSTNNMKSDSKILIRSVFINSATILLSWILVFYIWNPRGDETSFPVNPYLLLAVAIIPGLLSTICFTKTVYTNTRDLKLLKVFVFYFFSFAMTLFIALSLILVWGVYPIFTEGLQF